MHNPDEDVEIMPRAPLSHRQASAPMTAADLIVEQLQLVTGLHERFLAAMAGAPELGPEPIAGTEHHTGADDERIGCTVVDLDGRDLDRAGRMVPGRVVDQLLRLLPSDASVIDGELVFHRELPQPGDELRSSLTVTGSQFVGEVTDWLSLRGTLDDDMGSAPVAEVHGPDFDAAAVLAFADGRPADCFPGRRWDRTRTHVRSPGLGPQHILQLESISAWDSGAGLIAQGRALPASWSAPAALLEGCWQALIFQLAATGHAIRRDGWRYEPLVDAPARFRCRTHLPEGLPRYQLTVRSMTDTTVHADVVCTIGEQVVLSAEGLAVRLTHDTPLPYWRRRGPTTVQDRDDPVSPPTLAGPREQDPRAVTIGSIRYDYATLLASAWGPTSEVFPGASPIAFRLPGPPFLFITRLTAISAELGNPRPGSNLIAEYEIPEQAWFREQTGPIPVAVLLEIALQPCGFLAGYLASGTGDEHLRVRNLDGRLTTSRDVSTRTRLVRTVVDFDGLDRWDGMAIETFRFRCEADGELVLAGTAAFALTSNERLSAQTGLAVTSADTTAPDAGGGRPVTDLRSRPARYFGHSARLPGPMLLMLDRITGYWPTGGPAGLGRLRAELDVRSEAWYFKTHFLNDPVQPGSLGIEAMCQLLCCFLIERGIDDGFRFRPVVPESWTYRGQVVPDDAVVTVELTILDVELGPDGGSADAESWLWVDGRKIYHVPRLRVRAIPGSPDSPSVVDTVLDPVADPWLADHCPTWTVPAVPLMSTADLIAGAAGDHAGRPVRVLRDVRIQRWLPVTGPTRLRLTCTGEKIQIAVWHDAGALSRFAPVATATAEFHPPYRPGRFTPLPDLVDQPDPYEAAELFHGPSFRYLSTLQMGATGSTGVLDADRGSVPRGALHQGLLDAALHVIPHTAPHRWDRTIEPGRPAFPHRLVELAVFEPLPDHGEIEVEARYAGRADDLITVDVQLCREERVFVAFTIVEVVLPAGILPDASASECRAYLRDGVPDPRFLLSKPNGELRRHDVERFDTPAGTANIVYGLPIGTRAVDWLPQIALKEHLARARKVHPRTVEVVDLDNVSWDDHHAIVRTS